MRHFFSKTTVMATIWCQKCHADTVWKIAGGRPMHCTACLSKLEEPPPKKPPKPVQGELF